MTDIGDPQAREGKQRNNEKRTREGESKWDEGKR
jgi:hypothetical protein